MALDRIPTLSEAVAAALAVAQAHGLSDSAPKVLHASGNVWVHLSPHPVVAQVPKDVVAVRGSGAGAHLRRDLDLCAWAAARGLPVGAPADLLPAGPHEHEGLLVAFFRAYEPVAERDDEAAGRALRELHEALQDYPGALPEMEPVVHEPRRILGMLQAGQLLRASDLQLLRSRLQSAEFHMQGYEHQTVHGDVHLQNVAYTSEGVKWTDFETVCRAPVLWDLACLCTSTALYGIPSERLAAALRGYGANLDGKQLRPFVQARVVQVSAWAATRAGHDQRAAKRLADGLHWLRHHHL